MRERSWRSSSIGGAVLPPSNHGPPRSNQPNVPPDHRRTEANGTARPSCRNPSPNLNHYIMKPGTLIKTALLLAAGGIAPAFAGSSAPDPKVVVEEEKSL